MGLDLGTPPPAFLLTRHPPPSCNPWCPQNNTFCLGIFLALVWLRTLAWEFSAETISILAVQIIMFFFALKKTHRIFDGLIVLTLFPISIAVVALLEKAGLN